MQAVLDSLEWSFVHCDCQKRITTQGLRISSSVPPEEPPPLQELSQGSVRQTFPKASKHHSSNLQGSPEGLLDVQGKHGSPSWIWSPSCFRRALCFRIRQPLQ
ncbi:unnamed protein product [Ostreobium quekettii]|uniref:Uncharacterized protein n=1 Tax=Ostreobium quekettii TaxID=121088 RepID=A0A8S1ISV6_9CHLO|nr:unnamed protein product [Ostreobium quekettii]